MKFLALVLLIVGASIAFPQPGQSGSLLDLNLGANILNSGNTPNESGKNASSSAGTIFGNVVSGAFDKSTKAPNTISGIFDDLTVNNTSGPEESYPPKLGQSANATNSALEAAQTATSFAQFLADLSSVSSAGSSVASAVYKFISSLFTYFF
ncbi:uncharacterized protein LOC116346263 isoform X1 [Contarinia nasturtii]|uniref:uncharacterized protein LOC116346263 isoform X1 n=1 Tax=Contarinia nasturtii TaxID=265458 RepID=UPI0012D3F683|nr:uncharacterized protein LOC116346263 isoform X1 [Contarinia nasturtii]